MRFDWDSVHDSMKYGMDMVVTERDIIAALNDVGIRRGDVVIVHSSLKSMGYVEGGADTVIDALLKVLGENGTLVMPTLIQKDFSNAYQTWNLDKPSDVGLITETFRKRDGVIRSDQATHSVAAFGPLKQYLTRDHGKYGKRMGPFGDTPFAVCSPWQKLYDLNAKALMIGVSIVYNTSKHLTEYMMINHILDHVKDDSKREKLIARLKYHGCPPEEDKNRVWPYTSGEKIQEKADQAGLLIRSTCGNAVFTSFRIKDLSDYSERWFKESPEYWYGEPMLEWLKDANEE